MLRIDERERRGYRPPLETYPPRVPVTAMHPWVLVAASSLVLLCAIAYMAQSSEVAELRRSVAVLEAENARLVETDIKRRDEIDGLAQRAIDAELEAAALAEELDALKPGPVIGE